MRISRHRAIAAATAAAIALTSLAITPATARPYGHYHRGGGNAAVLGAVAGVFGTIALLAARRHHERQYGTAMATAIRPTPRRLRRTALRRTARTTATSRLTKPPVEAAIQQTEGAATRGAFFFALQRKALTDRRLIPVYKWTHG